MYNNMQHARSWKQAGKPHLEHNALVVHSSSSYSNQSQYWNKATDSKKFTSEYQDDVD